MLELQIYDNGVCRGCGQHHSLANDPAARFKIEVDRCDVCATLAVNDRLLDAADEAARAGLGDKPNPRTPRPTDGRKVGVRLVEIGGD